MAILGVFCFPGTGHINPFAALAKRLRQRGHRVIFFGIADTEERIRAAGAEFQQIGQSDYPRGTLGQLDEQLSRLKGLDTFRFTVERVRKHARMVLRDGPEAVAAAGVDALLVDEADMAGSIADLLKIPFVSVACFPPLVRDANIPPFCFGWPCGSDTFSRTRNYLGFLLLSRVAAPIYAEVNTYRRSWGLPPLLHSIDGLSTLAQITQLPEALEFPIPRKPDCLHYTGPFIDPEMRTPVPFPWDRLDGRPLVYASLGTLQNGSENIFATIAKACMGLKVQLVVSLGGNIDPAKLQSLPENAVLVRYAPQLEILKRASVVITHAGLNTTLESLSEGVPLVAIPLGNDQPGVAARIAHHRAGVVVPHGRLTAARLKKAVEEVLTRDTYRDSAGRIQRAIARSNGLDRAAEVVEDSLHLRARDSLPKAKSASPVLYAR